MAALSGPTAGLVASEFACAVDVLEVARPSDGYLHDTFFVSDGTREVVVKRFDQTLIGDLTVPLEDLIANTALAGRQGVGAEVLRVDSVAGLVVLDRLPGVPLTADDLADPGVLARAARALRRLHDCADLPANRIDFLEWSDRWLQSLASVECRWAAELARLRRELDQTRRLAARLPFRPSFSHNDLLPANFIDTGSTVGIIDYDFSGTGSPSFDLGCLFGNCAFDAPTRRRFLESYLGDPVGEEEVDAALARADLYEILAVHANGVVFTWAAYGYRDKFAPIAAEMDEVIGDHVARTRAAVVEGRHRDLGERVAARVR
jgi:aminoglycoside phosphotransferase (APT) family kinase protein